MLERGSLPSPPSSSSFPLFPHLPHKVVSILVSQSPEETWVSFCPPTQFGFSVILGNICVSFTAGPFAPFVQGLLVFIYENSNSLSYGKLTLTFVLWAFLTLFHSGMKSLGNGVNCYFCSGWMISWNDTVAADRTPPWRSSRASIRSR